MIITSKQAKNLKQGANIYTETGTTVILSDYDEYHNRYTVADIIFDDNGEEVGMGEEYHRCPADFVGEEMF